MYEYPRFWTLYYDWGCDGGVGNSEKSPSTRMELLQVPHTQASGFISMGNVLWRFDQAPSAVYGGNGVGTALTGASSTFASVATVARDAIKSGSPGLLAESAEVQAATGKMDVARATSQSKPLAGDLVLLYLSFVFTCTAPPPFAQHYPSGNSIVVEPALVTV